MAEQIGKGKLIAESDPEMAERTDGVQDHGAHGKQIGVQLTLEKLLEAAGIVKEILPSLN